jgi:hypothetical protein
VRGLAEAMAGYTKGTGERSRGAASGRMGRSSHPGMSRGITFIWRSEIILAAISPFHFDELSGTLEEWAKFADESLQ